MNSARQAFFKRKKNFEGHEIRFVSKLIMKICFYENLLIKGTLMQI